MVRRLPSGGTLFKPSLLCILDLTEAKRGKSASPLIRSAIPLGTSICQRPPRGGVPLSEKAGFIVGGEYGRRFTKSEGGETGSVTIDWDGDREVAKQRFMSLNLVF
jgi:hypothetical protein